MGKNTAHSITIQDDSDIHVCDYFFYFGVYFWAIGLGFRFNFLLSSVDDCLSIMNYPFGS
ncbi:MAG: hypothetical protein J07HQW1_01453 [Haloquadratum walsbyi J07HQW1]|uniref:Uncharacterized protein n=1 Tax=Haloquadratum walsbyi J07HQW1 TaxID=1238424 RepID=U1MNK4_9EURY|nr:MAG: hypothetical protein J07HQW1_01453 [Haloquadratum walsbyi J07HQW1]